MSRHGQNVDKTYVDPHLYPGVAVEVMAQVLPDDMPRNRHARFVGVSKSTPDKAWVIVYLWEWNGWRGEVLLVPLWGLRVSQRPAEPPPLPKWARLKAAG